MNNRAGQFRQVSLLIALVALLCIPFADLSITQLSPQQELLELAKGAITPDFFATEFLIEAILTTVAFAFEGIGLAVITGFAMALLYQWRSVRMVAALLRSVHELFWALLFMQVLGLSSLTGVLALWLPYTGIFAKVFGEILEQVDPATTTALPRQTGFSHKISQLIYARLPQAWPHITSYTRYRLECAMRSSIVLGFVGLPTLGYHLETAFRQGNYSEAAALLYLFYLLIVTLPLWFKQRAFPLYVIGAMIYLPPVANINTTLFINFFTVDLIPGPMRQPDWSMVDLGNWLGMLWQQQIGPGLWDTLVLSQIALLLTAVLALMWFPLRTPALLPKGLTRVGNLFLVVGRSTPEFVLAFVGLLVFGPSMLPAILALGIHNGAIIGHLVGGYVQSLPLREDDQPNGFSKLALYLYQLLPRAYPQFISLLLYRWEIIQRETAILGILGISTLGFYIDSAFEELRFDRAMVLIAATALLNLVVDATARALRRRLNPQTT